jgi:hypothetical protein
LEFSIESSISGWLAMKLAMRGTSQAVTKVEEMLRRSRRLASLPASGVVARINSPNARPVAIARRWPVGVTSTARCARLNSVSPIAFSRLRMRWLMADGVMCSASAASLKLPSRTAASNACSESNNAGLSRVAAGIGSAARRSRGGETAAERAAMAGLCLPPDSLSRQRRDR